MRLDDDIKQIISSLEQKAELLLRILEDWLLAWRFWLILSSQFLFFTTNEICIGSLNHEEK
jgi:hypothetical protein